MLHVPRDTWTELTLQASNMLDIKPSQLALTHIKAGLAAKKGVVPHKPPPTAVKIKKVITKKKDYELYLYNGEGPDGFYYENDREVIKTLKTFFYKISERARDLFDKCMVDPAKKPEGEALEVLADYTSQLWEIKQEKWDG